MGIQAHGTCFSRRWGNGPTNIRSTKSPAANLFGTNPAFSETQHLGLANGKALPLPINACGYAENDPFAYLKKFGAAGASKRH
jgi:hypothetical protein